MGRIQRMNERLANRIAAGEVVERPASVVKELVENSIDAGATSIRVELSEGGLSRIRVSDDGCGMDREDALLCFTRHATSKLTDDAELAAIRSLGFRGEALASIASVAHVVLQTGEGQGQGWEVIVTADQEPSIRPLARGRGTTITITRLFANTPARRAFLKSARSESAAVTAWMRKLALARPEIDITVTNDDREGLKVVAASDGDALKRRCEQLLGQGLSDGLVDVTGMREGSSLTGFIARPDLSRRDRRGIHLVINGRVVDDKRLQQAVIEGYRSVLEVGRFPVGVIYLETPDGFVDVNVHPQKTEVRLAQPRLLFSLLRESVMNRLASAPWLGLGGGEDVAKVYRPTPRSEQSRGALGSVFGARVSSWTGSKVSTGGPEREPSPISSAISPRMDPPKSVSPQPSLIQGLRYADLEPIGQISGTYLLMRGTEGLVIIDQHAAHERVVFGRLLLALRGEVLTRQGLLLPEVLPLDEEEASHLLEHRELAESFGYELAVAEGGIQVKAVPALLQDAKPLRLLVDLAQALVEYGGGDAVEKAVDAVIIRMACHGSIRAGQILSTDEMRALMKQLDDVEHRSHCPHGRPFVLQLTTEELERWFHRV